MVTDNLRPRFTLMEQPDVSRDAEAGLLPKT
jgi:hypothetical protein